MATVNRRKPAPRAAAKRAITAPARKAAIKTAVRASVAKSADKSKPAGKPKSGREPKSVTAARAPLPRIVAAATPVIKTVKKGPDMATTDTLEQNGYAAADRVQALFGDANGRAKTAMEKGTKLFEEVTEFTKGNVEAIVASGRVAAKGAETLGQEAAEYGKKSFAQASATLRSFAAVKSPTELFQLQSDFARTSFDAMVAESSKLSESFLKLAGDIAQPLSSRFALAAEKAKSASAF